ncbi:MAG: cytochrome b [Desulfobacterales bacterium]|jgi:cytochrome b561
MYFNTRDTYGLIARLLHWLIFLLVAGMLIGGFSLSYLPSNGIKSFVISIHKSIGVIILLLMITRLLWRIYNPQPRPLGESLIQNYAAHVLHIVLYILLFLQPLAGILMSQTYGYPVSVFGIFELPQIIWKSPLLASFFSKVHTVTGILLTVAIIIHAGAALKHHYIDRNRILIRMIKGS